MSDLIFDFHKITKYNKVEMVYYISSLVNKKDIIEKYKFEFMDKKRG